MPDKLSRNVQRDPLVWALPLQALLLLSNLDLLDPWSDEWFPLTTVAEPVRQLVTADPNHPPLYYLMLHYWSQLLSMLGPLASMRAMSAMWALVATGVIYFLLWRREDLWFQEKVLALGVMSPCLLLHARMARSYSMQLALALLAIYSAPQWADEPRNWKRLLAYGG